MKNTTKKFQFFDIERYDGENERMTQQTNSLSGVDPNQMYAFQKLLFVSAKVKRRVEGAFQSENLILKVYRDSILDSFKVFNKIIHYFQMKTFNNNHYFIVCGTDFKEIQMGNERRPTMLTSIKIYEVNQLLNREYIATDRNIESMLIKQINLLRNIETGQLYFGKDLPKNVETIQDVYSFSMNNDFTYCAIGLDRGQIILINVRCL